jgi:hypothetical protein
MIKELVAGAVVTVVIGGTAYTVNKEDVVENFADDTGLSQQEAEQYVNQVGQDELVPYDEVGNSYTESGQYILSTAREIDCENYEYDWESPTLSCAAGKSQLLELGNDEVALGQAYTRLDSDNATRDDIAATIRLLDDVNNGYDSNIVRNIIEFSFIDESKKTNSYNKATLQAALESEE